MARNRSLSQLLPDPPPEGEVRRTRRAGGGPLGRLRIAGFGGSAFAPDSPGRLGAFAGDRGGGGSVLGPPGRRGSFFSAICPPASALPPPPFGPRRDRPRAPRAQGGCATGSAAG